jgi:hypothetical protein
MADIVRRASITVETRSAQHAAQIPASLGVVAGTAISGGMPCYIGTADGKVYPCQGGTAASSDAYALDGWAGKDYQADEPVTLWGKGVIFQYGTDLTPGAALYFGTAVGGLAGTAAGTAVAVTSPIAKAISSTHIRVTRDS